MNKFILASLFAFCLGASAEVQFLKITGASNVSLNVAGVTTIFGGLGGDACEDSPDACNSCENVACDTAPFCSCNTTRIGDNQVVRMSVISDFVGRGQWALTDVGGNPQYIFGNYIPGTTQNLTITWGQLCNGNSGMGASCEGPSFRAGLLLGIWDGHAMIDSSVLEVVTLYPGSDVIDDCDKHNGAICGFQIRGGKKGPLLTNLVADQSWPAYASKVRIYGSTKDFAHASPVDATFVQDLNVNNDGSVDSQLKLKTIDMTFFRLAAIDMANNISSFTSNKNILDPKFGNCSSLTDNDPKSGCRYRFTPANKKK